ncbi:MAG: bifunctional pyr operon transcriptional regulator/uracil phosphoribosyltransferase PyrR [candidate division WOR-3 bacterium]|nr:bifunctional pyr operon transcriptional regulator/uracil phosphoribosyltransferase PyrR [candidate division WOR-3 bacterium]
MNNKSREILADSNAVSTMIEDIAVRISEKTPSLPNTVLIGIIKRGDIIASRISSIIARRTGIGLPVGKIDINLYRDDLSLIDYHPSIEHTSIPFDINSKTVILIDDVFFTGRTIRSALNEIMDFGRPDKIKLFTLINRQSSELPICPDYSALNKKITKNDIINLHLNEIDGREDIEIIKGEN